MLGRAVITVVWQIAIVQLQQHAARYAFGR
jgi:hypothetical protein